MQSRFLHEADAGLCSLGERPLKRPGKEGAIAEPLVPSTPLLEAGGWLPLASVAHLLFVLCRAPAPLLKQSADGIVPMLMHELAERFPRVAHWPMRQHTVSRSTMHRHAILCSTDCVTLVQIYRNDTWCISGVCMSLSKSTVSEFVKFFRPLFLDWTLPR